MSPIDFGTLMERTTSTAATAAKGYMLMRRKTQEGCTKETQPVIVTIVEAWSQGFMVGAIIILMMMTISNMMRGVLLHKLILCELFLAMFHGTFYLVENPEAADWYLSATATGLYISYQLHNIINWIKNKPFLPRWGSWVYIGTIVMVQPYWVAETFLNFEYFNKLGNDHFQQTRPFEPLLRDPWWIFTSCSLLFVIKRSYNLKIGELIKLSPRFGIFILCVSLSICFIVADIVQTATNGKKCDGENPYWKLTLVFKCGADAIFLDDFKKILDRLSAKALGKFRSHNPDGLSASSQRRGSEMDPYPQSRSHRGGSFMGGSKNDKRGSNAFAHGRAKEINDDKLDNGHLSPHAQFQLSPSVNRSADPPSPIEEDREFFKPSASPFNAHGQPLDSLPNGGRGPKARPSVVANPAPSTTTEGSEFASSPLDDLDGERRNGRAPSSGEKNVNEIV